MAKQVSVREVGLRDGLQLASQQVATDTKIAWCQAQAAAGFHEIEVTSFVPAHIIPQFTDAKEVLAAAQRCEGLLPTVLVPNLKGAQIAMDLGAEKISYVMSASPEHNLANVRKTVAESLAMFTELIAERKRRGLEGKLLITGVLSTSFGCSIQGDVPEVEVLRLVEAFAAAGADEVNVADTVGYGNPVQVRRVLTEAVKVASGVPLAAHFHDTRGMGLANVVAATQAGVYRFDSSLGGLGGCPFAPGATGNIATEDCVYLLESMGFDTGIDMEALLEIRAKLPDWLPSEPLEGRLGRAGLAKIFTKTSPNPQKANA